MMLDIIVMVIISFVLLIIFVICFFWVVIVVLFFIFFCCKFIFCVLCVSFNSNNKIFKVLLRFFWFLFSNVILIF